MTCPFPFERSSVRVWRWVPVLICPILDYMCASLPNLAAPAGRASPQSFSGEISICTSSSDTSTSLLLGAQAWHFRTAGLDTDHLRHPVIYFNSLKSVAPFLHMGTTISALCSHQGNEHSMSSLQRQVVGIAKCLHPKNVGPLKPAL